MKQRVRFLICDICYSTNGLLFLSCSCGRAICQQCACLQLGCRPPNLLDSNVEVRCNSCLLNRKYCYLCKDSGINLKRCEKCQLFYHASCVPAHNEKCPFQVCDGCTQKIVSSRAICYMCKGAFHKKCTQDFCVVNDDMYNSLVVCPRCERHLGIKDVDQVRDALLRLGRRGCNAVQISCFSFVLQHFYYSRDIFDSFKALLREKEFIMQFEMTNPLTYEIICTQLSTECYEILIEAIEEHFNFLALRRGMPLASYAHIFILAFYVVYGNYFKKEEYSPEQLHFIKQSLIFKHCIDVMHNAVDEIPSERSNCKDITKLLGGNTPFRTFFCHNFYFLCREIMSYADNFQLVIDNYISSLNSFPEDIKNIEVDNIYNCTCPLEYVELLIDLEVVSKFNSTRRSRVTNEPEQKISITTEREDEQEEEETCRISLTDIITLTSFPEKEQDNELEYASVDDIKGSNLKAPPVVEEDTIQEISDKEPSSNENTSEESPSNKEVSGTAIKQDDVIERQSDKIASGREQPQHIVILENQIENAVAQLNQKNEINDELLDYLNDIYIKMKIQINDQLISQHTNALISFQSEQRQQFSFNETIKKLLAYLNINVTNLELSEFCNYIWHYTKDNLEVETIACAIGLGKEVISMFNAQDDFSILSEYRTDSSVEATDLLNQKQSDVVGFSSYELDVSKEHEAQLDNVQSVSEKAAEGRDFSVESSNDYSNQVISISRKLKYNTSDEYQIVVGVHQCANEYSEKELLDIEQKASCFDEQLRSNEMVVIQEYEFPKYQAIGIEQ